MYDPMSVVTKLAISLGYKSPCPVVYLDNISQLCFQAKLVPTQHVSPADAVVPYNREMYSKFTTARRQLLSWADRFRLEHAHLCYTFASAARRITLSQCYTIDTFSASADGIVTSQDIQHMAEHGPIHELAVEIADVSFSARHLPRISIVFTCRREHTDTDTDSVSAIQEFFYNMNNMLLSAYLDLISRITRRLIFFEKSTSVASSVHTGLRLTQFSTYLIHTTNNNNDGRFFTTAADPSVQVQVPQIWADVPQTDFQWGRSVPTLTPNNNLIYKPPSPGPDQWPKSPVYEPQSPVYEPQSPVYMPPSPSYNIEETTPQEYDPEHADM